MERLSARYTASSALQENAQNGVGGTCIWKVLHGDRFSEDIDAYASSTPKDIADYLKKELALLGINCNILKRKKTANILFLKFALAFRAHHREILMSLEILSDMPKETKRATLYSPYPDIPPVEMIILAAAEMLANKVSAVYNSNRPRDVHDIYQLLKSGTEINMQSIRKKFQILSCKHLRKRSWKNRQHGKA